MRRAFAFAAPLLATLAACAAPSALGGGMPVSLDLGPSVVGQGDTFSAVLAGCVFDEADGAGEPVQFTIDGEPAAEVECEPDATASAMLTAPTVPGDYTVEGSSDNGTDEATLTVLPPLVLTISPATVLTGAEFEASVAGCATGGFVAFFVEGSEASTECVGGSASVQLDAPDAPGDYEVEASQVGSGRTDTATLTVLPVLELSLSPSTVEAGAVFTSVLNGCTTGGSVDFSIEGGDSDTTQCVGGSATRLATLELTAPLSPGDYEVTATDTSSGVTATADLTVIPVPVLTLSPSTVTTGALFTATLEGCIAEEPVQFTVAGASASDDCTGGVATAALTAPSQAGDYPVEALLTESGRTTSAPLAVIPPPEEGVVVLSARNVETGATLTATLQGCTDGEEVEFTVRGDSDTTSCVGDSASSVLTAPSLPGTYDVEGVATGSGVTAVANLTVTGPPDEAVVVSDATPAAGAIFRVTLRGCMIGEQVLFTVQGSSDTAQCEEVIGGVAGEARAIFGAENTAAVGELTAPSEPGQYVVEAVALTSGVRGTFVITVEGLTGGPTPTTAPTTVPPTIPITL